MHYLVIVAVARQTKVKRNFNYERNSQQRLNLKRTSRTRTILANQTTVLAFFRTAMYFFVAGLSTRNLIEN
jgi:uncharacterized membrane protein YidH (DUF202 family)